MHTNSFSEQEAFLKKSYILYYKCEKKKEKEEKVKKGIPKQDKLKENNLKWVTLFFRLATYTVNTIFLFGE